MPDSSCIARNYISSAVVDNARVPGTDHGVAHLRPSAWRHEGLLRGGRLCKVCHLYGLGEAALSRAWAVAEQTIPEPLTDGYLFWVVVNDSINLKAGGKAFAGQRLVDDPAETEGVCLSSKLRACRGDPSKRRSVGGAHPRDRRVEWRRRWYGLPMAFVPAVRGKVTLP